jgi:hypothetical protein
MFFQLTFNTHIENLLANSWGHILSVRPELVDDFEFIHFTEVRE